MVFSSAVAAGVGSQMRDYTVEFWANPAATQADGAAIVSSSAWALTEVGASSGQYVWQVGAARTPTFAIPAGGWHHVALTYRGSSGLLTVYVDGRAVASAANFPEPAVPNGPLYLGRSQAGVHWQGLLQYVRFSKLVRYPTPTGQALLGFAGGAPGFGHGAVVAQLPPGVAFTPPTGPFVADVGSIAIWNMDEGAGTVIHDASGNNFGGVFEAPAGAGIWTDDATPVAQAVAAANAPAATTTLVTATAASLPELPSTGDGGTSDPWPFVVLLAAGLLPAAASLWRRRPRS